MPAHPLALELLEKYPNPIVAPSANISGKISATRYEHLKWLENVDQDGVILEGKVPQIGLESTILKCGNEPQILREGGISRKQIEEIIGERIGEYCDEAILSPGLLKGHYAPDKPLFLEQENKTAHHYFIGFGDIEGDVNLSKSGDVFEAAEKLYDILHQANHSKEEAIAIAPIPNNGIGIAINDRLKRAAHGSQQGEKK